MDSEQNIRQLISFSKNWREKPISRFEDDINGTRKFAILKTTENGKYLRGNMLFYSLNGIEIYTESTNVIFVDLKNNTLFIKEYEKVLAEINPLDAESKQYIMLYTDLGYDNENGIGNSEFPLRWEAVTGRTEAYKNIKLNLDIIDVEKSLVLVETVPFKDSLTVKQFVEYIKNGNLVDEEDDLDINDYSTSEYM